MAGLEYRTPQGVGVAADYVPESGGIGRTMSLAARYETPRGVGAQLGVGKLGNDTKFFGGVTYRFDSTKAGR